MRAQEGTAGKVTTCAEGIVLLQKIILQEIIVRRGAGDKLDFTSIEMPIPLLGQLSSLWKPRVKVAPEHRHLMLAGISQSIFLKQWGPPQVEMKLDDPEGPYREEAIAIDSDSAGTFSESVWIYPQQDRIFFFRNKKMVSHFKWSTFKEKKGGGPEKPGHGLTYVNKRPPALVAYTLSLVA